jgi:hypothetical protein
VPISSLRSALQCLYRRTRLRAWPYSPSRVRDGRRRDVERRLHGVLAGYARACGRLLPQWRDCVRVHGLAPHGRTAHRGPGGVLRTKNLCIWNKTNGGMGSFYRSKHELVFVFKIGDAPHLNTPSRRRGPSPQSSPGRPRSLWPREILSRRKSLPLPIALAGMPPPPYRFIDWFNEKEPDSHALIRSCEPNSRDVDELCLCAQNTSGFPHSGFQRRA